MEKSSDQTDKGSRDCRDKNGWLDAACMKHRDNLTSLDTGCITWWDCQDNLTCLDTECMTHRDNLTCLDVETVETILIILTGQHYIVR